jgi:hypothetical protein
MQAVLLVNLVWVDVELVRVMELVVILVRLVYIWME